MRKCWKLPFDIGSQWSLTEAIRIIGFLAFIQFWVRVQVGECIMSLWYRERWNDSVSFWMETRKSAIEKFHDSQCDREERRYIVRMKVLRT